MIDGLVLCRSEIEIALEFGGRMFVHLGHGDGGLDETRCGFPKKTGKASRATKRKISSTIAMAESETRKMNFSASHSTGGLVAAMDSHPACERRGFNVLGLASRGVKVMRAAQ